MPASYVQVASIFLSEPAVPAVYGDDGGSIPWKKRKAAKLIRVERIENKHQESGALSRYHAIADEISSAGGMQFTGGVHTRWLFHASQKVEQIVNNPIKGFVELAGERFQWGKGEHSFPAAIARLLLSAARSSGMLL